MAATHATRLQAPQEQNLGYRLDRGTTTTAQVRSDYEGLMSSLPVQRPSNYRSNLPRQYALPLRSTQFSTGRGSNDTLSSPMSEHFLRRKTPSGSLTAAYDGTPVESNTATHAVKHFLIPFEAALDRRSAHNIGSRTNGQASGPTTKISSHTRTGRELSHGIYGPTAHDSGGAHGANAGASLWQQRHGTYSSYPIPPNDASIQGIHGQYGHVMQSQPMYHGPNAMQPPFQAAIAPTISNNQGPFGPYWPNGTFVPYQPAPYRDPRYGLSSEQWAEKAMQNGPSDHSVQDIYKTSAQHLYSNKGQTHDANATIRQSNTFHGVNNGMPPVGYNQPFQGTYQPAHLGQMRSGYQGVPNANVTGYPEQRLSGLNQPSRATEYMQQKQAVLPAGYQADSELRFDELHDPDKVLKWAVSIYSELLSAVQQARREGNHLQGSNGHSHVHRINIYPEPVKKTRRREQLSHKKESGQNPHPGGPNGSHSTDSQHQTISQTTAPFLPKESSEFSFSSTQHFWPSNHLRDGLSRHPWPDVNGGSPHVLGRTSYDQPCYPPNPMTETASTKIMTRPDVTSKAHVALDIITKLYHENNNRWVEGLLLGGSLAYLLGDYQTALNWYSKILQLDSNHVEAMSNLAATYLSVNRRRDAEQYWRHAIKLRPSYFEAVEHLVGLLCFEQRNKDAIQIIETVQTHLRCTRSYGPQDSPSDQESTTSDIPSLGLATSVSEPQDKIYFESSQARDHYSPTMSKTGSMKHSSRYSIPASDNGRIMALIHAKGNMLYNLQNHASAARAFEEVVLVAAGQRSRDMDAFVKFISSTLVQFVKNHPQGLDETAQPLLLTPDMALQTARLCFPTDGELPGLQDIENAMSKKAAISVTSNSLLSLAKIFQDGMHHSPSIAGTQRVTCGVQDILALYYLSLSLQPSPSTANNVGILMASVQQSVVPKRPNATTNGDYYLFPGVVPGSGIALALTYYNYGLNLDSKHAHLFTNLGSLLKDIGQLSTAIKMYEKAVAWDPNFDIALANLANAVKDQGKTSDAIGYYKRAVQVNPNFAEAVCGLANALNSICNWQGRGGVFVPESRFDRWHVDDAGNLVDSRVLGKPQNGWIKRVVEIVDGQLKEGEGFGKGILQGDFLKSMVKNAFFHGEGQVFHQDPGNSLQTILQSWLNQPWEGARTVRFVERTGRRIAWKWYQDKYIKRKEKPLASYARPQLPTNLGTPQAPTVLPFHTFTFPMTARQIRLISQRNGLRVSCSTLRSSWLPKVVFRPPSPPSPRLNVGYVSSDFNNHPLAHLMQSVFGMHDLRRVKAFCYATTPSDGSVHRQQIENEAPQFYDASSWPIERVVKQIVNDNIHILINLNGYTRGARNEIFGARPAPVQMAFMGFAGTLGAEWCDYLLADDTAVPPRTLRPYRNNVTLEDLAMDENSGSSDENWVYGENIIYTRSSFFCCDHRQSGSSSAEKELTWTGAQNRRRDMRKELFPNLNDDAIIFANFNQLYKIDPTTFRTWLRILSRVPNSILWLLRFPDLGESHLRSTATAWAGASIAARIVFTDVAPKAKHIARACVADLFLDTPECNAHTTAADCLWSGTPLLTLPRYEWKMCSRMAAGILRGALPETEAGNRAWDELVCSSEEEYEEKAVWLGKGLRFREVDEVVEGERPFDVTNTKPGETLTKDVDSDRVGGTGTHHGQLQYHGRSPAKIKHGVSMPPSATKTLTTAPSTSRITRKVLAPEGRLHELRKLLWSNRWTCKLFDTKRWVSDLEDAYEEAWERWVEGRGGDIWLKDIPSKSEQ